MSLQWNRQNHKELEFSIHSKSHFFDFIFFPPLLSSSRTKSAQDNIKIFHENGKRVIVIQNYILFNINKFWKVFKQSSKCAILRVSKSVWYFTCVCLQNALLRLVPFKTFQLKWKQNFPLESRFHYKHIRSALVINALFCILAQHSQFSGFAVSHSAKIY